MASGLQPLADRVLVKPIEKEKRTESGIYIPDTARERPDEGQVVAVGPGRLSDDGRRIAGDIQVGDTVVYRNYSGTEIKVEGEELLILHEDDILAKKTES
jgi:chaperonin GroES